MFSTTGLGHDCRRSPRRLMIFARYTCCLPKFPLPAMSLSRPTRDHLPRHVSSIDYEFFVKADQSAQCRQFGAQHNQLFARNAQWLERDEGRLQEHPDKAVGHRGKVNRIRLCVKAKAAISSRIVVSVNVPDGPQVRVSEQRREP